MHQMRSPRNLLQIVAVALALVGAVLFSADAALAGPNTSECRGVITNRGIIVSNC